jgi:branched-chain amino acid transport system permease protein
VIPEAVPRFWSHAGWRFLAGILFTVGCVTVIVSLGNDYLALVLAIAGAYAIAVSGLNLLTGSSGQLSFGHNSFFAIGAYAVAIGETTWHIPFWESLAIGILGSVAVALVIGLPVARLRGHYLSMATLAFGLLAYNVVSNAQITHGFVGISGIPPVTIGPLSALTHKGGAEIMWLFALGVVTTIWLIRRSPFGKIVEAVRDDETLALACGISVGWIRTAVFVLSSTYAALGGGLLAGSITYISPELFDIHTIATFFLIMYLGGTENLWGCLVASLVVTAVPQQLSWLANWQMPVFGLILILYFIFQDDLHLGTRLISSAVQRWRDRHLSGYPLEALRTGRDEE